MPRKSRRENRLHSSPVFSRALGRTIKVIRTDLGIDRRTLAQEAGISYSYLTEIENGNKPPSSSVLGPIVDALGLRMSELVRAAEDRVETSELAQDQLVSRQRSAVDTQPRPPMRPAVDRLSATSNPSISTGPPLETRTGEEESPQILDRFELELRTAPQRHYAMAPSFRGPNRSLRAALLELEALLPSLSADDVERILDFARRLAR